ncbi:MAG: hypothetical protein WBH28_12810 [Fuerstiella sp.]
MANFRYHVQLPNWQLGRAVTTHQLDDKTLLAACPDTGFGLDMITEMMYQVFG